MTTKRDYAASPADLPTGTLVDLFLDTVDRLADRVAFQFFPGPGPELVPISYRSAYDSVRAVAAALEAAGLRRGDRAAILSENRPEWALADYGCLCAGVPVVPVYSTLTASQVGYILENSGARLVFASNAEQAQKVLEACDAYTLDARVVTFEETGIDGERVGSWGDFIDGGRERAQATSDEAFRSEARIARPDDLATILYTSGTTGPPKGVMLTHDNLHSNVVAAGMVLRVLESDSTLSFLPLSHVMQRMVDYLLFSCGCTIAYAHDIKTVAADLRITRPTVVVAVPRVYEKVYNSVMGATGVKAVLVRWASRVATRWTECELAGRPVPLTLRVAHRLADRLVYGKIRAAVGGRVRFFISGSAPLEPSIATFFYGAGMRILEGYGLTETSPVTNVNRMEAIKIGTVGPPVPGTEIRIAEDGEILVRGPQVMKGYYERPEATAEAIDEEGWFHTGDIGVIDEDDFLAITDRKKDLIVTAGGKNVAPQPIENRLKTNPLVEQVVMVGDRRKFCSLLIVPAFEALEAWAGGEGISFADRAELIGDPAVQAKMSREILGGLGDLASYERPKKVALLLDEFTIEDGTLTPTQKVKRRVVQERFDAVIDALYAEQNVTRDVIAATEVSLGGVG